MNGKLQRERDEQQHWNEKRQREGFLFSYKVVGGEFW